VVCGAFDFWKVKVVKGCVGHKVMTALFFCHSLRRFGVLFKGNECPQWGGAKGKDEG